MAFTETRADLLKALGQIQNHPAFAHQDIMTITGCGMTDDEVRQHIEACMSYVGRFNLSQIEEAAAKAEARRNRRRKAA